MSLINRMLQDLDARRSDGGSPVPYGEQVRAVPERRAIHPAWWVALALAIALIGLLAWLLLRPPVAAQPGDRPRLPLKLDMSIDGVTPAPTSGISKQAIAASPTAHENRVSPPAIPPSVPVASSVQPAVPAPVVTLPKAAPEDSQPAASKRPLPKATAPVQTPTETSAVPHEPAAAPDQKKQPATANAQLPATTKPAEAATAPVALNKQVREPTPQQRAENEYRKALVSLQQGKSSEAIASLELSLQLDPQLAAARQTLIGALVDAGRVDDAVRRTREALQQDPSQAGLAMVLARLQMEKGELRSAIETLERTLPYGAERADYQAFLAALMQRDQRHKEATQHYLQALKTSPQNGVWWMGLGISLQADNRLPEAQEAFKRAKASNTLSAELQAFVDTKLGQLKQ